MLFFHICPDLRIGCFCLRSSHPMLCTVYFKCHHIIRFIILCPFPFILIINRKTKHNPFQNPAVFPFFLEDINPFNELPAQLPAFLAVHFLKQQVKVIKNLLYIIRRTNSFPQSLHPLFQLPDPVLQNLNPVISLINFQLNSLVFIVIIF